MRALLILMGCLALAGGCASNDEDEDRLSTGDPVGAGDAGAATGGAAGGGATGTSNGSGGTGGTSAGTTDGGQSGTDAAVDTDDPPVPTEACGTDLDVHNGTIRPKFNAPKDGDVFTGDPLEMGSRKVVLEDKTLKNPDAARNDFNVTMYGPSSDGSTVDAGPFPLIVVLPGFSGNHTGYRHFTDHFVSHGFAVLGITCANVAFTDAPNNPANVAEIQVALSWALEESSLKGKIDNGRMAIAGHSQGGKLAFYTAATDPRFKLVLGWDPQNGGGAPCFVAGFTGQNCNGWPVAPNCDPDRMFEDAGMLATVRGESITFAARDTNITPDAHMWAEHFYRGAPSPASLVLFPSAGHGDWAAAGANTDLTQRVQMALLLTRFMGKSGLDKYLPEGEYAAGEASVMVYTK